MKSWWQSKTIWLGIATGVISFLTWLTGEPYIANNPQVVSYIGAAIAVITIWLRTQTTQPLG